MKTYKEYMEELDEAAGAFNVVPQTLKDIEHHKWFVSPIQKSLVMNIHKKFKSHFKQNFLDVLPLAFRASPSINVKFGTYTVKDINKFMKKIVPKSFDIKSTVKTISITNGTETVLSVTKGEGSRNNKAGGGKQGKDFEDKLANDLNRLKGGAKSGFMYAKIVNELIDLLKSDYKIDMTKDDFDAIVEGGKNQKRNVSFDGKNFTSSPSGNIGKIVTDVTITSGSTKVYLSLKYSKQFYLINSSVRPYLGKPGFYSKERDNLFLALGLNPTEMNGMYDFPTTVDKEPSDAATKKSLSKLIKEVVGFGYIKIVGGGKRDIVANLKTASDVKVTKILNRIYPITGKRKYAAVNFELELDGERYFVQNQLRGTYSTDEGPYYMRMLVRQN